MKRGNPLGVDGNPPDLGEVAQVPMQQGPQRSATEALAIGALRKHHVQVGVALEHLGILTNVGQPVSSLQVRLCSRSKR